MNIAQRIVEVAEIYGIGDKIGYYMADSVSNNGTVIEALNPILRDKFGSKATMIPVDERQLRCFGHNLNLSVKALLFGTDPNAIETSHATTVNDEKAIEAAFLV